ncbi:sigma 54-interacting transcriptional regulator [Alcaligenaceae bacterium]|nr:sigma 54-interacting transcriptional regulator [Alcaligenaceae bacterium]
MADPGNQFHPEPGAESDMINAWEVLLREAHRPAPQPRRNIADTAWQCCRNATVAPHSQQDSTPAHQDQFSMRSEANRAKPAPLRALTNPEKHQGWAELVSANPAMLELVTRAQVLRNAHAPVLLHGETGVGKELFARGLHTGGPFVAINCGGLPRDLLASELFGYGDGAFTGARKGGMPGKIEAASGGTLFLDEIGEMPLEMQAHLLRVLEQKELYRVGETVPRNVTFRLVAATNRDLRQEAQAGRFRLDLFYRIAVFTLHIPPLRNRDGDISLLAHHFWHQFCREHALPSAGIDDAAMQALQAYSWPGNVRELRNVLESARLLSSGCTLMRDMLPPEIVRASHKGCEPALCNNVISMEQGERLLIQQAITACSGNLTLAAKKLNIAKSTLYFKMGRYGLSRRVL